MCGQAVCQQYGSTGWVFALHIGPTCCIPSWHRTLVAQVLSPPRAIPADSPPLSRPEELTPQESEAGTCPGQESLDKRTSRQADQERLNRQENRSRCRTEEVTLRPRHSGHGVSRGVTPSLPNKPSSQDGFHSPTPRPSLHHNYHCTKKKDKYQAMQ